jgi:TonB family protein
MEKLFQRLLEATLLTVLLLLVPLELLAQEKEALQPSSGSSAFSKDLQEPQKTQTDEQRATEPPLAQSGCWTSPERDKHVRVIEQSVTAGRLIHKVPPKYPKSARKAHIEGTVVLCAEIRKDGKVANLRVLSGPKELIDPSIKAVQQWVYKPYLLDGEPVEVETDIRVNFRLE